LSSSNHKFPSNKSLQLCRVRCLVFARALFIGITLSPGQTRKHCCGNICDSRCFLKCFPVCPPVETLLRKQNLLPKKQKCFLPNSETFDVSLCFSLMFPSVCSLWETLAGNNVSATMFPSLPRALVFVHELVVRARQLDSVAYFY
jgi:hypothetical protein